MVNEPGSLAEVPSKRPSDLAELRDVVRAAAETGQRVLVTGGSTSLGWGAPVGDVDLRVDMTGLNSVIEYRPEDMTVRVGAGITLVALQRVLAEHGQRIAFDPPGVREGGAREAATVGGLLASGDSGPARHRYGTLRDLVIGITVVVPDGLVARSGGHVIKNVTGYDLAKLFFGSLGTLGVVAEVVLRVHPTPQASRTVAVDGVDAGDARELTVALLHSPYEPVAIEWLGDQARLVARFEGTGAGAAACSGGARDLLASHPVQGVSGIAELNDEEAELVWRQHASAVLGQPGDTTMLAAVTPRALAEVASGLAGIGRDSGVTTSLVSTVSQGVHAARLTDGDVVGQAACLRDWRELVEARGGSVQLRDHRQGLPELAACWGSEPSDVEVMRRIKRAFDPDGRYAPGRFAPWFS